MEEKVLDYVLVPVGLGGMLVYHVWLFHQIVKLPTSTVIGINAINRRFWVQAMMKDASKNGVLAVQTLRNNIMASTLLASTAIMLSSVIAVLMTGMSRQWGGEHDHEPDSSSSSPTGMWFLDVVGDKSQLAFSIKYFSILVCFLVAFLFNVQSIRYYSHASILINVPTDHHPRQAHHYCVTPDYVAATVNRGSYFWSLGLRAFYFSFPLFFWIFGPIPMFLCCVLLVFLLYFLDLTLDLGWVGGTCTQHEMENPPFRDENDRSN
ncbi:uncharacterized protein LOC113761923 [Coffea eugenioides]|uniref:uncharacterized protein LOC113761923 n=1 Tax=Coffea eugenioides TaxID=49369 RepID=UPI000F615A45|nr:uncharacterized protein LOC113761923 [Coffea eugenioides]